MSRGLRRAGARLLGALTLRRKDRELGEEFASHLELLIEENIRRGVPPDEARRLARIRFGNLTMTSHPIHIHGHEFVVAGTDGGWVPPAARWPEVTTNVAVGQMRAMNRLSW